MTQKQKKSLKNAIYLQHNGQFWVGFPIKMIQFEMFIHFFLTKFYFVEIYIDLTAFYGICVSVLSRSTSFTD